MTDRPDPDRTSPPPAEPDPLRPSSPVRRQARRVARAGISLIWAVPAIALVVTLALAWNIYSGRGVLVPVAFSDATGITPGETVVKFREITVGKVEAVRFTQDLKRVVLDLRVDDDIAKYIDANAQFWIVRPQVSARGISRLDTVLTGVFVEGDWDSEIGPEPETMLQGLDRPPLVRANEAGSWVVLSSDSASGISEGAPVMYRGVPVGRMENLRISDRDDGVIADVFIEAPHDRRLTTATVFWDTSGLSVSLGVQGLALNVNSLASLLQGGIQFDTLTSGGQPVPPGHVFRLEPDEATARASVFSDDETNDLRLTVLVDSAVRGLAKGADVQFQGLTVGRVADLKVRVIPGADGRARQVVQDVTIAVSPARLGLPTDSTPEQALAFLVERVADGLRARVASAGFLGTSLMVELVQVPGAPPARIAADAEPFPVLPSVESDIEDFTATAQGFISKIGALPLGETLRSFQDMANSITAFASSEDTRAVPQTLRKTLDEARSALEEVRSIATSLREGGASENAAATLAEARSLAERLNAASETLPDLIARLDGIAADAEGLDIAALGTRATEAASALRDLAGSEAVQALPGRVSEAVTSLLASAEAAVAAVKGPADEVQGLAADFRASGAVERIAPLLAEAEAAAAAVKLAAADVPDMVTKMDAAAESIDAFDFAGISAEAEGILQDLRAMLGTEDAGQLPKNLNDTLAAASGLLTDLRDGNAAGSLNTALASASTAADEVAVAARRLPQLSQRFEQLAARAEAVIATYGDRSAFNTEALTMMRELRRATAAFGSLARTIERNPRAFILGR